MARSGKHQADQKTHETLPGRKAGKAKSSKVTFTVDESDTGEALSQSESWSKAVNKIAAKRSDALMTSLEITVEDGKQELANFLMEGLQDVLQTHAHMEAAYTSGVTDSLKQPDLADMEPFSRSVEQKAALHPVYQTAKSLIGSSRRLIQVYDKICEEIASSRGIMRFGKEWDLDCSKLDTIFEKQKRITKHKIEVCLQERSGTTKDRRTADARPAADDLWISFAGSQTADHIDKQDENWAVAVRRVGRGVQHLVKHLPDDE